MIHNMMQNMLFPFILKLFYISVFFVILSLKKYENLLSVYIYTQVNEQQLSLLHV